MKSCTSCSCKVNSLNPGDNITSVLCVSSKTVKLTLSKFKYNLLISRTHSLLKYLIKRNNGLTEKHVQSDKHPVHDRQDQVPSPWGVCAPTTVLQDPGEQLEAALLVPLGHLHLLHQPGGVLLLPHLDDGVEVAAAVLALGSQPSCAEDGDIHMCGYPSLIIIQIYQ